MNLLKIIVTPINMPNTNKTISAPTSIGNLDAVQLVQSYPKVPLTVDCVLFGFEENTLQVLLIKSDLDLFKGKLSLLGDKVNSNEDLSTAANRVL